MSLITKTKLNNKGFSHLEIGITIVVVAVIAVVGGFVYNKNNNKSKASTATPATVQVNKPSNTKVVFDITNTKKATVAPEIPVPTGFDPTEGQEPPKIANMQLISGTDTESAAQSTSNTKTLARKAAFPKVYAWGVGACRNNKGNVWHVGYVDYGSGNTYQSNAPHYFQVQRRGNANWEYNPLSRSDSSKPYSFNFTDDWRESGGDARPIRYRLMKARNINQQIWVSKWFTPARINSRC